MPRVLRMSAALYPAMGATLVLGMLFSRRTPVGPDLLLDRVFPFLFRRHAPGSGTFIPGSFAANFLGTSWLLMLLLNAALPALSRGLPGLGVRLYWYLLLLVVAILEVFADTMLPILALPGP